MNSRHEATRLRIFLQLALLALAAGSANFVKSSLGPIQEAMRLALAMTDNQTALLQGLALAVPVALGSIPVGLMADRISRRRILIACMGLAFLACVLSSLASTFTFLLAARCLAGLTLPGLVVTAYSMAGDLSSPTARGRATMIVAVGEIAGAPAAFALGGALLVVVRTSERLKPLGAVLTDWQWTLLWMSGLLLPVLILLWFLRDPPRSEVVIERPSLRAVWLELWKYRALALPLQVARAALFIADGAVYVWGAPLFARQFHMAPDRIGTMLGATLLIGGLLGPALGGPLVDWCQHNGGPRRAMKILTGIALASAPMGLFALMPTALGADILLGVFLALGWAMAAAALALTLIVIPGELRGLNVAFSLVVGSLFFVGLAPLVVSELSTTFGGEAMIGKALSVVCAIASLFIATVFALGIRYFPAIDPVVLDLGR